jgi:hypothetical protein
LNRTPALCGPKPPVGAPPPHCLTLLSSSRTPSLTTGPRCRLAPPVHRTASPAPRHSPLFAQQRRCPLRMARGCYRPRPSPKAADCHARGLLSLSSISFPPHGTESPPDFPVLFSTARPLELPSFSTAYTPTSPTPTTGDPCSSLVPTRAPPLSVSTTTHSLSVQIYSSVTFFLLPRHCRATPSTSSITGAASPPLLIVCNFLELIRIELDHTLKNKVFLITSYTSVQI